MPNIIPIFQFALYLLAISAFISLSIVLFVTALYSPVILNNRLNAKRSKEIVEQNIQVVEDATFFVKNKQYQEAIDKQLAQIAENESIISKHKRSIAQLEKDIDKLNKK